MSHSIETPDFPHHHRPIEIIVPENVLQAIAAKYNSLGGAAGVLGGDERLRLPQKTPGTNGWHAFFKKGEIYWLPETGAVAIYGAIWDKWKSAGSLTSHLAYPVSDMATNVPG